LDAKKRSKARVIKKATEMLDLDLEYVSKSMAFFRVHHNDFQ
jgi:hypothetical protein